MRNETEEAHAVTAARAEAPPQGLIFRDATERLTAGEAAGRCVDTLRAAADGGAAARVGAVLEAGALEAALADSGAPEEEAARAAGDAAVARYLGREAAGLETAAGGLERALEGSRVALAMRRPEGFAYYALSPAAWVSTVNTLYPPTRPVCVVGIRTIGSTLAALAVGALRGASAESAGAHRWLGRVSVRPTGHPFDRRVSLVPAARALVAEAQERGAAFLVVDEGPGMSGSSFLAAAEALEAAGVPARAITLLGTAAVDPQRLVAPRAAERWARYRAVAVRGEPRPSDAERAVGGGAWREELGVGSEGADEPAVWAAMERPKFLSRDGERLYKFEGLGRFGAAAQRRAQTLAAAGLAPAVTVSLDEHGYVGWPRLHGVRRRRGDGRAVPLASLIRQAVVRAREVTADESAIDVAGLAEMARFNTEALTGTLLPRPLRLEVVSPVVSDGRLDPHEWLEDDIGRTWKVDHTSHGDDHFYPGPVDVAWDLAGTVVEWDVAPEAVAESYGRLSGDDVSLRLPDYAVAYAAFRACHARAAGFGSAGADKARWAAEADRYTRALAAACRRLG